MDGDLVTASDVARALASECELIRQANRAARTVIAESNDASECRLFFMMFGIDAVAVDAVVRNARAWVS